MSSEVGARVVESAGFLKKLFTSVRSSNTDSVGQKVSRRGRQQV